MIFSIGQERRASRYLYKPSGNERDAWVLWLQNLCCPLQRHDLSNRLWSGYFMQTNIFHMAYIQTTIFVFTCAIPENTELYQEWNMIPSYLQRSQYLQAKIACKETTKNISDQLDLPYADAKRMPFSLHYIQMSEILTLGSLSQQHLQLQSKETNTIRCDMLWNYLIPGTLETRYLKRVSNSIWKVDVSIHS